MILISVGTEKYDFSRLIRILDELCNEKIIDGTQIIAQIGCCNYKAKKFKCFDLISHDEYEKLLDECDTIICHAGTGSVIPALEKEKKVIMFPRLQKYGEHIDNHQLELSNYLSKNGYALLATNKEELEQAIYSKICLKKFESNKNNFIKQICKCIE